jgi:hypothetical protein
MIYYRLKTNERNLRKIILNELNNIEFDYDLFSIQPKMHKKRILFKNEIKLKRTINPSDCQLLS